MSRDAGLRSLQWKLPERPISAGCVRTTRIASATTRRWAFSYCAMAWGARPPVRWPANSASVVCSPSSGRRRGKTNTRRANLAPRFRPRPRPWATLCRRRIWRFARRCAADSEKSGMGTTIVAALVRGDHLAIAHAGDSRLYRLHGNTIEQLTNDHSLVMEQVRHGLLTPEQAAQSPLQNIITRALGVGDTVEVELADWELATGDTLLLCSDGLNRHLSDERILSIVTESSSLATACKELIASANEAGEATTLPACWCAWGECRRSWVSRWDGKKEGSAVAEPSFFQTLSL